LWPDAFARLKICQKCICYWRSSQRSPDPLAEFGGRFAVGRMGREGEAREGKGRTGRKRRGGEGRGRKGTGRAFPSLSFPSLPSSFLLSFLSLSLPEGKKEGRGGEKRG